MGASCSFPLKEEEDSARDGDKEDDRDAYGEEDGSSDEGVERQAVSIRGPPDKTTTTKRNKTPKKKQAKKCLDALTIN